MTELNDFEQGFLRSLVDEPNSERDDEAEGYTSYTVLDDGTLEVVFVGDEGLTYTGRWRLELVSGSVEFTE